MDIVPVMVSEGWPVVYAGGRGAAFMPVDGDRKWPVAVDGEYLVLANPKLVNADQK